MAINTEYVEKSIRVLEKSYEMLLSVPKSSIEYEIFRNSTIKCFEVTLEQVGKLLRKKIKPYFASVLEADKLNYKEVFRYASKHGLLTNELVERWFIYRDNRNDTVHDYGEGFAEETVGLLKNFIPDAKKIVQIIGNI